MAQTGTKLPQTRISGQIIIDELVRNMELGRLEMGYSILLPCIFSIYLHPDDYARIAGVQDIIKDDARRALTARMAEWNGENVALPPRRPRPRAPKGLSHRAERLVDRVVRRYRGCRPAGRRGNPLRAERRRATRLPRRQNHPHRARAVRHLPCAWCATAPAPDSAPAARRPSVYAEIRYQDDSGPQTYLRHPERESASGGAAKTSGSICRSTPTMRSRASICACAATRPPAPSPSSTRAATAPG